MNPKPKAVRFVADANGISFLEPNRITPGPTMGWDGVTHVFAFKKDCFSVDQIRMIIGFRSEEAYELTEDDEGFAELARNLPAWVPGIDRDWNEFLVTTPAFDPTVHVALKRD